MEGLKIDGFEYHHYYLTADGKQVWVCTSPKCTVKLITTTTKDVVRKVGKHQHNIETGYAPGRSLLADYQRRKEQRLTEKERVKKIQGRAELERKKCDYDVKMREAVLRKNFLEELGYAQL